MAEFKDLVGKTITKIKANKGDERIHIWTEDNKYYQMNHTQDCCEFVCVEDICGELTDLIGSPILQAEESTNSNGHLENYKPDYTSESFTWTFYRIATIKGQVVIRWLGTSNGYYSERVSFDEVDDYNSTGE